MGQTALPLRVFLGLLMAAIPPATGLLVALAILPPAAPTSDVVLAAGAVVLFSIGWIATLSVIFVRLLRTEVTTLLDLAERGEPLSIGDAGGERDAAHRRLAVALDERNRQVADLAAQASLAPIGDEPRRVAAHVVRASRSVTRDPTWTLAVLDSAMPDLLPRGVYDGEEVDGSPSEVTDLHTWAAAADVADQRAARVEGPWGAFVVVAVAADDQLRAVLLAPWEGRPQPTPAEVALLAVVGEHASVSIEHALLYAQVQAQADVLDRMAEVQRDFLRAVSHDLQTPLTSIRAVANELRAQPGLNQQAGADLELIEQQAERLRRMVAQLLVVSRLEAGVIEPRQELVNARVVVERTWDALRPVDRQLQLDLEGPPMLLVADPDRLEQVIWAVLDNAIKYSPAGTRVSVRISLDGQRAAISVTDEGAGMDSTTANRAFDQFFRSEAARRLAPDGSGIGLYAARGLMQAMGGSATLESTLGQGTTVRLELPAEPIEEARAPEPSSSV
jgi:signal transduction histidine kinase